MIWFFRLCGGAGIVEEGRGRFSLRVARGFLLNVRERSCWSGTPGWMPKFGSVSGISPEKICDGGVEVAFGEDLGVAEDVHQERVGAVGAVQLHPLPVGSSADAAMCGVGLGEAARPCRGWRRWRRSWRDESCRGGLARLFVAAEDDAGFGPVVCSCRRLLVVARCWARAFRSRRRSDADQMVLSALRACES